ncbi:type II toxin-antitoxin system RelE/ParE family toxin [Brevundimonas sp.]|uniref:type II toxin-antitoxin system RelE/ParE family toxin n=1 Tax=Brevundimonas sp. TaxID=1871086 RepID=UPI002E148F6D|nr:type II toxin-antitoxin system RelE/ParE family toxin [Brevundimonas sp.]
MDDLLRESERRFGPEAARRYRALLAAAIAWLLREPETPTARPAPVMRPSRMVHLRSARRLMPVGERVAAPRHVVVYRFDDAKLEIVQILDDRMDIPRRLR